MTQKGNHLKETPIDKIKKTCSEKSKGKVTEPIIKHMLTLDWLFKDDDNSKASNNFKTDPELAFSLDRYLSRYP